MTEAFLLVTVEQISKSALAHGRLVPVIGDVGLAAWKANSRNAHM